MPSSLLREYPSTKRLFFNPIGCLGSLATDQRVPPGISYFQFMIHGRGDDAGPRRKRSLFI